MKLMLMSIGCLTTPLRTNGGNEMILKETEYALEELAADIDYVYGQHDSDEVVTGSDGLVIGERPYDSDEPTDINFSSLMGHATNSFYVEESIPERPLSVSIVEHRDAKDAPLEEQSDPRLRDILNGKRFLVRLLSETLQDSLPGSEDVVNRYVIGKPTAADLEDMGVEVLEGTEDPDKAVAELEDISSEGLTILVDSIRLPFDKFAAGTFQTMLAIKANHLTERQLLPNDGVWRTGNSKMPEVDTSDPLELARWNTYLDKLHEYRLGKIKELGIVAASVVLDPRINNPYHLDVKATDIEISSALKAIGRSLY